jgi:hypothetical protein
MRVMSPARLSLVGWLALWPGCLQAHDIYSPLVDNHGGSCCHDRDCRPAPYRLTASDVEMFVEGKWIAVPAETIVYRALPGDTGETGGGHWCGVRYDADLGNIYLTRCAVLPPQAAALGHVIP